MDTSEARERDSAMTTDARPRDVFAFTVEIPDDGPSRWVYFGPNCATVFGRKVGPTAPLAELLELYSFPEDLPTARDMLAATRAGEPTEVELRIVGLDESIRWVSWRLVPRTVDGRLLVDGVATEITARQSLSMSRAAAAEDGMEDELRREAARQYATAIRDAHDEILQRLFAAGLRLQMLRSRLDETDAHAVAAIGFQLDQAAADLRELIKNLDSASRS